MKKLMFGMAVAAGLMACADIESSNIVGYADVGLQNGATMCAPMFLAVGSETEVNINSLLPIGEEIDPDGGINIQTLDAYGRMVDTYNWIDWGGDDVGWMNDEFEKVDVKFARGTALWTTALSTGTKLQNAGEVSLKDCKVQLCDGATAAGNMMATEVSIQDIVLEGDEIDTDGGINIQTLDAYGRMVDMYNWIDWGGEDVGWMNDEFEKVDVKFAPGQGLWITAMNDSTYIRFPAPETK